MQNSGISIIISKIKNFFKSKTASYKIPAHNAQIDNYTAQRQYVGNIVISVLTERISVRKGLLLFPKGCEDPSIRAAWHALCHYEADEDIRQKDIEYNNQQVELLEMIAFAFKDGSPLPQNIIESYKPYYQDDPISYESGLRGLIKKLFRFVNF